MLKRIIRILLSTVLIAMVTFFAGCSDDGSTSPNNTGGDNPPEFDIFLANLSDAELPNRQELVDEFISSLESNESFGFPLVTDSSVTWIYLGEEGDTIYIAGDHNQWNENASVMSTVEGTNLFYYRAYFPSDARLDYKFVNGGEWLLDPRNPRQIASDSGFNSELAMPEYIDPPEIFRIDSILHGSVDERRFESEILGNTRDIHIYLPFGYSNRITSFPVIYIMDGNEYLTLGSMTNVLNYCIANSLCIPVIAVFVDAMNRNYEYHMNYDFSRFIVRELVPYIDNKYRTITEPESRAIMGESLGGLTAAYLAYNNSTVFGKAGGHSSALQIEDGRLTTIINDGPYFNIEFYFDAGVFEGDLLDANREMRTTLLNRGYTLTYNEYNEGHSWGNWRAHIDEILKAFFSPEV